jgi:small conductance mechanosensitive channel
MFSLSLLSQNSESSSVVSQGLGSVMGVVTTYGPSLFMAVLTLLVGWWIAKLLTGVLRRVLDKREIDAALTGFLTSIVYALLMTLVILSALDKVGVPTTSFVAVVGAAGLAIGFALQGSLANFAAGVMLIFFRPFKSGDLVEVSGILGVVEDVQIFATMLVSLDNKKIVVPNAAVTSGNIVNFSAKETRRVDLVFGIGYGDDIKAAKEVMSAVLEKNEYVLAEPAPNVAVSELGDSSVNFVVRPWCKTDDYWDAYFSVTEEIKLALDANGISIPFPQRDVHLHQVA